MKAGGAPDDRRVALRRDAARAVLGVGLLLGVLLALLVTALGFAPSYPLKVLVVWGAGVALTLKALPALHPHRRFGSANQVTLVRLAVACLFAGLVGEQRLADLDVAWGLIVVATVSAVADAADGPLARRQGLASDFGARFDMETDAFLLLVLSVLVWQAGQAGAWVLAAGLMRYAFVAAAARWPWLSAPLPPSWRRKAVCVVQITALIVCLGPIIPPAAASMLAALTLAALSWSFGIDIVWLARHRRPAVGPDGHAHGQEASP